MDLKTNRNGLRSTGTCGRTNFGHVLPHWETTLGRKQSHAWRRTDRWLAKSPLQLDPDWPIIAQSANTLASPWAEHPSRCAHGPGRGDHATPSRPRRLNACAGGAACVTAVRVSGTEGYQLRQCSTPLTCPVRRGGGACSGLPARQEPINSWGVFFCFVLFWYSHNGSWTPLFTCVCVQPLLGGMRGVCSALKMGLFLHAVGSVPPTESAAERVRLSQKQGCLSRGY